MQRAQQSRGHVLSEGTGLNHGDNGHCGEQGHKEVRRGWGVKERKRRHHTVDDNVLNSLIRD
ncbi:MAG: hypothetical protein FMNOHCHN_03700 [Ignavibacteriaceae bacterium]|nr:hypothetical protein [Ignavibacteriaceae bacterium]